MSKIRILGIVFVIIGILCASFGLLLLSSEIAAFQVQLNGILNEIIDDTISFVYMWSNWHLSMVIAMIGLSLIGVGAICFAFIKEK